MGRVSRAAYRTMINDVVRLLDGEGQKVVDELSAKRDHAAVELKFERAAAIQKQIERLQQVFVYLQVHRR